MKSKIKSVSDIPDWLKNKSYEKRLTKIDWYREIRMRHEILVALNLRETSGFPVAELTDESRSIYLKLLKTKPLPGSVIFFIDHSAHPVRDLTAGETLYLRSALRDDDLREYGKKLDEVFSLWLEMLKEGPTASSSRMRDHEGRVDKFYDDLEKSTYAEKLNEPIEKFLMPTGAHWHSYGRPVNGVPITVDTQYDDETIVGFFKQWLANRRKTTGERARRPFLQNDFDDWEYFKTREVFDLETWAWIMNVKIPDSVIAKFLWPNPSDDFSPIDVLRTTARKKVKEVFKHKVVVRLYGQLLLEYGENFFVE